MLLMLCFDLELKLCCQSCNPSCPQPSLESGLSSLPPMLIVSLVTLRFVLEYLCKEGTPRTPRILMQGRTRAIRGRRGEHQPVDYSFLQVGSKLGGILKQGT